MHSRFLDGRPGISIDGRNIVATSPKEAIAMAKLYECRNPKMELLSALLYGPSGATIWVSHGEKPEMNRLHLTEI